ncbi:MAG: site-specific integrase [Peptococcaceae bacterium]|nr:site-specific integrase [Peptococcaceae bacterium]
MASIEYKGLNRKGEAVFRIYIEGPKLADGNRNRKRETYKVPHPNKKIKLEQFEKNAMKQAEDYARDREKEINRPGYREPTKETFAQHVERWLKVHGETLAPKTLYRYKELLDRILPYLGPLPVIEIQMEHIEDLYRALAKEPRQDRKEGTLSATTIQHHARVLNTVLEYAVKRQLIPSNPAKYAKPEPPKKKDIQFFSETHIAKLTEILEEESLLNKVLVNLALSTGARAGELAALTWDDIDEEKRTVRINKSAQYIPGQGSFVKQTKTESSKRTVTVSASVIFLLKQLKGEWEAQKEELGTKWIENSNSVFYGWNGAPVHPEYPSHWWHKFIQRAMFEVVKEDYWSARHKRFISFEICKKTGIPQVSFHGLRHSCASLLLSKGQSPVAVAKRLGHSNTNVTLAVYAHTYQKDDQANADIMEKIINTPKEEAIKQKSQA